MAAFALRPFAILLLAILAVTWVAPPAAAQTVSPSPFGRVRQSAEYQTAIASTAARTSAFAATACDATRPPRIDLLFVTRDPAFDDRGRLAGGEWGERLSFAGCRPERVFNILVRVGAGGRMESEPLLPGTTKASPLLQMDAISFAFDAARVDRAGCRPIYVIDTQFTGFFQPPDPAIAQRPWAETWTVAQCDTRKAVAMTFVPDRTGTVISASTPAK